MNKFKQLWGKHFLVTVISLGFVILGIGFISWAMFNIWSQSHYSASATNGKYLGPIAIITAPQKLEGDNIGSLTIPALNQKLPIVQGTDEKELKKGVGHFDQSVLPGEEDNCVFSGHRETAFSKIGNLKIGDQLIVEPSAGVFTYEVSGTRIVHEDDKTVIVPTDHAVLTLTTCYPFNYIGNAPDRYIVSADLVKSK